MEFEKFRKFAGTISSKNKVVEEGKMFGKECILIPACSQKGANFCDCL